MAADIAPRAVDVARLGDDLEVVLVVEQQDQPPPHDGVVISDDDPDDPGRLSGA